VKKKDDRVYLAHIRDAMAWVLEYGKMEREAFLGDHKTQMAMVREYEVMGEAAKNLSADVRGKYPDIPWRGMAGLRDVAIHQYEGLNMVLFWEFTKKEIPVLKPKIDAMLLDLGEPEKG
jgi:uncharacterized protein with HEPN domain